MERLPEMFAILRPGYRYMYVSLCKNTIVPRKRKAPFVAPVGTTQRYCLVNIDCNTLEYLPIHSRWYDAMVHEESANSPHDRKCSTVAWKSEHRATPHCSDVEYYCLPFALYYNGDRYPIIDFSCGRLWLSKPGSDYKFMLSLDDEQSIQLLNPGRYNLSYYLSEPVENNEYAPAVLQDDKKEPEPIVNIPNKLPTFVIENHMHYEIARSECPIASIGLKECDRVSMLDCYHVFDSALIRTWMNMKAECPVCKSKSTIIHTLSVPKSIPSHPGSMEMNRGSIIKQIPPIPKPARDIIIKQIPVSSAASP